MNGLQRRARAEPAKRAENFLAHARYRFVFFEPLQQGLGRTGTIASRLLVEFGTPPDEAIRQVRAARRGAVQTIQQERYVLGISPLPGEE